MFEKFLSIEKLHFMVNNGHLEMYLKNTERKRVVTKSIKNRLNYFLGLIINLLKKNEIDNNIDTWLLYETKNNLNTLLPLKSKKNIIVKPNNNIIYNYLFFYKLFYFIPLLIYLIKKNKIKWFFLYFDSLGILEESERILKKYKPKKVVFANDHNPYQVALRIKAQKLKILTFYVQHACVGMNMPPLEFDVSFLDGLDAYNKYKKIGDIKGKIELTGVIRAHSKKLKVNTNKKVKRIGIALNKYDKIDDVKKTIDKILEIKEVQEIHIRLHPGDSRTLIYNSEKIKYSDSKKEISFKFLEKIDLLIAGDSSIHLDAAILNVVPLYFKFSKHNVFDIYEFVKNGLVIYSKDIENLICILKKEIIIKTNVLNRAAYYDEYIRKGVSYKEILEKYNII